MARDATGDGANTAGRGPLGLIASTNRREPERIGISLSELAKRAGIDVRSVAPPGVPVR
jgi:hypothetical protein